jgi:RNA polymerase sigma-70 factor (ECF subfamily)
VPDELPFAELMRRVRARDPRATEELVRRYEPQIRRWARTRLGSSALQRVLDSVDVCQSVLANLLLRAERGQFELDTPEQLLKLLRAMVQNKMTDLWRKYEVRILGTAPLRGDAAVAGDLTPDQEAWARELEELARQRLAADEWQLLRWRDQGREWADIAAETGQGAEALRKKLARAVERISQELGIRPGA